MTKRTMVIVPALVIALTAAFSFSAMAADAKVKKADTAVKTDVKAADQTATPSDCEAMMAKMKAMKNADGKMDGMGKMDSMGKMDNMSKMDSMPMGDMKMDNMKMGDMKMEDMKCMKKDAAKSDDMANMPGMSTTK